MIPMLAIHPVCESFQKFPMPTSVSLVGVIQILWFPDSLETNTL